MPNLATKVRKHRLILGLSQSQLADRVGVQRRTIQTYELGEKMPRPSTMKALARALGVSVEYLTDDACDSPLEGIVTDAQLRVASKDGVAARRDPAVNTVLGLADLMTDNPWFLTSLGLTAEEIDRFALAALGCHTVSRWQFAPPFVSDRASRLSGDAGLESDTSHRTSDSLVVQTLPEVANKTATTGNSELDEPVSPGSGSATGGAVCSAQAEAADILHTTRQAATKTPAPMHSGRYHIAARSTGRNGAGAGTGTAHHPRSRRPAAVCRRVANTAGTGGRGGGPL